MREFTDIHNQELYDTLRQGGIGVLRTDTLYGLVCCAKNADAVQRIYTLKSRAETKSPIVLLGDLSQLFDQPSPNMQAVLARVWPGKVSVVLPSQKAPTWIRRDNNSVAYRLPNNASLQNLVNTVGILIAPSANPEGQPPAMSIAEAKAYFGSQVDFYCDGGQVDDASPSQLIRVDEMGVTERLR